MFEVQAGVKIRGRLRFGRTGLNSKRRGIDLRCISGREIRVLDAEGGSGFFTGSELNDKLFGEVKARESLVSDGGKGEPAHGGKLSEGEVAELVHLVKRVFDK
jgi:hypothetical protein